MSVATDDSLIPASSSSFCNRWASRVIRPAKQTDSRAATFEGESVEVDAMRSDYLRGLCVAPSSSGSTATR